MQYVLRKVFLHYSLFHVKEPVLEPNIDPSLLCQTDNFFSLMAAKQY